MEAYELHFKQIFTIDFEEEWKTGCLYACIKSRKFMGKSWTLWDIIMVMKSNVYDDQDKIICTKGHSEYLQSIRNADHKTDP